MTRIIDEDIIRQHPVSDAYREGWERTFGNGEPETEPKEFKRETLGEWVPCDPLPGVSEEIDRLCKMVEGSTGIDGIECKITTWANVQPTPTTVSFPVEACADCGDPGHTSLDCPHAPDCEKCCTEGAECNCGWR